MLHKEPLWRRRECVLLAALVVLALLIGLVRPDFLRPDNFRDILLNASIPAIVAAGMTALIITAEIDISVGAILAVCGVVIALLARSGWPIPALILAGTAAGAALGAVNGALTAGLRIPSIVATLATLGAIRGLLVLLSGGDSIPVPNEVTQIGSTHVLGLPVPVWCAALTVAGMGFYLSRTRNGRRHYAVGSNTRAAQLSGIATRWVVFRSFLLLGALTGFAGFLFVSRFTPIYPKAQPGFELEVITAVVVGGTDIFGGRGTIAGTVLAAILLKMIEVGLQYIAGSTPGFRSEIQPAVQGLLILLAVLYNSFSRKSE